MPVVYRLRLVERQQKEQAYGHMNGVKIHNQWRRIMRMAKTEELKQDIEILSQSYDRTVDRKDALIQVHSWPVYVMLKSNGTLGMHHCTHNLTAALLCTAYVPVKQCYCLPAST